MNKQIKKLMNFVHSFYAKIALVLLVSFFVLGAGFIFLTENLSRTYQDEVRQKLHLGLADYIATHNAPLKNGQVDPKALKDTFTGMMILGPDFEFYLLDKNGKILAHAAKPEKIKRESINMDPILEFINEESMLPILGDDPRSEQGKKVFSAAEVVDEQGMKVYLYIIIGGEIYDSIVDLLKGSHIVTLSFWVLIAGLSFSLIVVLFLFGLLTRPIRKLTADIQRFRDQGFSSQGSTVSDWKADTGDEIQQLGASFKVMADELKEQFDKVKTTDEIRRDLFSYISHDLRTPLASLQGYLETWQLKNADITEEESQRYIRVAADNARQISHLVEQLFELAHLEGSDVKVNFEPVVIAELAQDVLQQFELKAAEKKVKFEIEPRDSSYIVLADMEKLERIITNLVDNAFRHCVAGDMISILFSKQDDELDDIDEIRVEIADTGSGIAEEDLTHIFEPHFRGKNTNSDSKVNSGLGLAITKRLLELQDSDISVRSTEQEGTVFTFSLKCTRLS